MDGFRRNSNTNRSNSPEKKTQTKKCENENKRREDENRLLSEIAELLPDNTFDDNIPNNGYNKPDKANILNAAVVYMQNKAKISEAGQVSSSEETDSNNGAIQQSQVSSTKPIIPNDIQCPLILEALGFWFVVNGHGRIEFVSKNISQYINYSQDDLIGQSIYNIIAIGDTFHFTSRLDPLSVGNCSGDVESSKSCTFTCRMRRKITGNDIGSLYEVMQITTVLQTYPTENDCNSSPTSCDSNQACLVCFARHVPSSEKTSQLSKVTTKQDLLGNILACDFTDDDGNCSNPQVIGQNIHDFCHSSDVEYLKTHHSNVIKQGSNLSPTYRTRLFDVNSIHKYVFVQTKSKLFKNKSTGDGEFIMSTHSLIRVCSKEELQGSARSSLVRSLIDSSDCSSGIMPCDSLGEEQLTDPFFTLVTPSSNADDLMNMIDELSNSYNPNGSQWDCSSENIDEIVTDSNGAELFDLEKINAGQFLGSCQSGTSHLLHAGYSFSASPRMSNFNCSSEMLHHPAVGTMSSGNNFKRSLTQRSQDLKKCSLGQPNAGVGRQKLRKLLESNLSESGSVSSTTDTASQDTILKQLLNEPDEDEEPGSVYVPIPKSTKPSSSKVTEQKKEVKRASPKERSSLLVNLLNEQEEMTEENKPKSFGLLHTLLKQSDEDRGHSSTPSPVNAPSQKKKPSKLLSELLAAEPATIPTPILNKLTSAEHKTVQDDKVESSNGAAMNGKVSTTISTKDLKKHPGQTCDSNAKVLASKSSYQPDKDSSVDSCEMSKQQTDNSMSTSGFSSDEFPNIKLEVISQPSTPQMVIDKNSSSIPYNAYSNPSVSATGYPASNPKSPNFKTVNHLVDPLKKIFRQLWEEQSVLDQKQNSPSIGNRRFSDHSQLNVRKRKISEASVDSADSSASKPSERNKLLASLLAKPSNQEDGEKTVAGVDSVATAMPKPKVNSGETGDEKTLVHNNSLAVSDGGATWNTSKIKRTSSLSNFASSNLDSLYMLEAIPLNSHETAVSPNSSKHQHGTIVSQGLNSSSSAASSSRPLAPQHISASSMNTTMTSSVATTHTLTLEDISDPTWDLQDIDYNQLIKDLCVLEGNQQNSPKAQKENGPEKSLLELELRGIPSHLSGVSGSGSPVQGRSNLTNNSLSHIYDLLCNSDETGKLDSAISSTPSSSRPVHPPQNAMAKQQMVDYSCDKKLLPRSISSNEFVSTMENKGRNTPRFIAPNTSQSERKVYFPAPSLNLSVVGPLSASQMPCHPASGNPRRPLIRQQLLQHQQNKQMFRHQLMAVQPEHVRFGNHVAVQQSFSQLATPLPDNFSEIMKTALAPNVTLQRSPVSQYRPGMISPVSQGSPVKAASIRDYSNAQQWQPERPIITSPHPPGQPPAHGQIQGPYPGMVSEMSRYPNLHAVAASSPMMVSHRQPMPQGHGIGMVPSPAGHPPMPVSPYSDVPMLMSPPSAVNKLSPGSSGSVQSPTSINANFPSPHGMSQAVYPGLQLSPGAQRQYSNSPQKTSLPGSPGGTSQFVKQQLHGFINSRVQQQQQQQALVSGGAKSHLEQTGSDCALFSPDNSLAFEVSNDDKITKGENDSKAQPSKGKLSTGTLPLHHSPCGTFLKPASLSVTKGFSPVRPSSNISSNSDTATNSFGEEIVENSENNYSIPCPKQLHAVSDFAAVSKRTPTTSLLQQLLSDNS